MLHGLFNTSLHYLHVKMLEDGDLK